MFYVVLGARTRNLANISRSEGSYLVVTLKRKFGIRSILLSFRFSYFFRFSFPVLDWLTCGLGDIWDLWEISAFLTFLIRWKSTVRILVPTYGSDFTSCLNNFCKVLARCEEKNLVLNWEKCHFIVNDEIVLGHKVSAPGIEVDRAIIKVKTGLPKPTNVKDLRSFLGHAGFYRRFIKDFSKIARPLTALLCK